MEIPNDIAERWMLIDEAVSGVTPTFDVTYHAGKLKEAIIEEQVKAAYDDLRSAR